MRQSIIKIGIDNFLNTIKFNEEYYSIYNNIFNETVRLDKEMFIFFILQAASHTKFHGYFDELYVDVIKRRSDYIRYVIYNFKIAFLGEPTRANKIYKLFCCGKPTEREIYFNRKISLVDFDKLINSYFDLNNNTKKSDFIDVCESIYNYRTSQILNEQVHIKIKKKVQFSDKSIQISS